MRPNDLPDADAIWTAKEFADRTTGALAGSLSSSLFRQHRRSVQWNDLYESLDTCDQCRTEYLRLKGDGAREIRDPARLGQVAHAYLAYTDSLRDAADRLSAWGSDHSNSRNDRAAQELGGIIQGARQQAIDSKRLLPEIPVSNAVQLAWVGSAPGDDVVRSAHIWGASQPGAKITVWTDQRNLLANEFKNYSESLLNPNQQTPLEHDPCLTERWRVWDGATAEQKAAGLDRRLQDIGHPVAANIQQQRAQFEQSKQQLNVLAWQHGYQIEVKDVSELFSPQITGPRRGAYREEEGAMTAQDRADLRTTYETEVQRRMNFGAGTDVVRVVAGHDKPGVYADIDMTPPVKGLDSLIHNWNLSLERALQRNDITDYPSGYPDQPVERMASRVDRARRYGRPLPNAIDPGNGIANAYIGVEYNHLIGAVDEHIEGLRLGSAGGPRPKLAALNAFLAGDGTANAPRAEMRQAVMASFGAWQQQVTRLENAYESLPQIAVRPDLFKILQSGPGRVSNAVVATSSEGSPALAEWGRQISKTALQNSRRPAYFDDQSRDYAKITMNTTGANTMSNNWELAGILQKKFGVGPLGGQDPLLLMPSAAFPHPSSSAPHCSWSPSVARGPRPTLSRGPQTRGGPRGGAAPPARGTGRVKKAKFTL